MIVALIQGRIHQNYQSHQTGLHDALDPDNRPLDKDQDAIIAQQQKMRRFSKS